MVMLVVFNHIIRISIYSFCSCSSSPEIAAGLGIFTGIDLDEGEAIAEPDIIIPLHDIYWHAKEDIDFEFIWHQYSWMTSEVNMHFDMNAADSSALVVGTGCMPNCNFALINAHESKVREG